MSGVDFLADTNVLIYTLEAYPALEGGMGCSIAVPVISEIEILGCKGITPPEISAIRALLNDCTVLKLSNKIKEVAIVLKQKYSIKLPDAVIAATAICSGLPLVTADTGFKRIENLNLVLLTL
jgi:predicted nucleic acid-binding protein